MKKLLYWGILFLILPTACQNDKVQSAGNNAESRSSIIQASSINTQIKNGKNIIYKDASIIGDINFLNSTDKNAVSPNLMNYNVNSSLVFYNCTFKGKVTASDKNSKSEKHCTFNKNLTFINCTFQDTVDFSSSVFKDVVNLSSSQFHAFSNFKSVKISAQGLYFQNAHFFALAKFNMMHSEGICNFFKTVFDDNAMFQLSVFKSTAQFNAAKFHKNANFTKSKFKDDVFFNYAEFYKKAQFNTSYFTSRTEFSQSTFNMISEFKNCIFLAHTIFTDAKVIGIITFENSIFYISNPRKFHFKLSEESTVLLEKTSSLLK